MPNGNENVILKSHEEIEISMKAISMAEKY